MKTLRLSSRRGSGSMDARIAPCGSSCCRSESGQAHWCPAGWLQIGSRVHRFQWVWRVLCGQAESQGRICITLCAVSLNVVARCVIAPENRPRTRLGAWTRHLLISHPERVVHAAWAWTWSGLELVQVRGVRQQKLPISFGFIRYLVGSNVEPVMPVSPPAHDLRWLADAEEPLRCLPLMKCPACGADDIIRARLV